MTQRILVLSCAVPWPANTGGRIRTARLVDALRDRYEVTVVAFTYDGETYDQPPAGVSLVTVRHELPSLLSDMTSELPEVRSRALAELDDANAEPWFAVYYSVPGMAAALRRLSGPYDAVLIEGSDMARFLDELPRGPRVLDLMDVCAAMAERRAQSGRDATSADLHRVLRFETQVAARCDLVLTVSLDEQEAARRLLGVASLVVPNGVDIPIMRPVAAACQAAECLLFVGSMDYWPNAEGALWLRDDVMPALRRDRPAAHVHVVGRNPPAELRAGDAFFVHPNVPDVAPYYQSADVVLVPVLNGGGTRLKVLEAAAFEKAIVSTSLGCEGIGAVDEQHLIVANGVDDFVAATCRLLQDPPRSKRLGQEARQLAEQFTWERVGAQLLSALESVVDTQAAAGTSGRRSPR